MSQQQRLLGELPAENKTFSAISREIAESNLDKQAAKSLDENNIQAAEKLFQDAFRTWGPAGLRQFVDSVSALESKNVGLDLKLGAQPDPYGGERIVRDVDVIQSRSGLANTLGAQPYSIGSTEIQKTVGRANNDWESRSYKAREQELYDDVTRMSSQLADPATRKSFTAELADLLNNDYDKHKRYMASDGYSEPTVKSYLLNPKHWDYGKKLMSELVYKNPSKTLFESLPTRVPASCDSNIFTRSLNNPVCTRWSAERNNVTR